MAPTRGLSLISSISVSLASLREDGILSVIAAAATAAAVREDERRVVLAGERDRLRRRPGERERERDRERVWKPATFWWRREGKIKQRIANILNTLEKKSSLHVLCF